MDIKMTVDGGDVCVFDGYKTVIFERSGADVPASEEVVFRRGEVVIRTSGEVEPIAAARLFVEYLELIRSCPRYRTDDEVNCKDRDCLSLRESTPHPPQKRHLPLEGKAIEMKPKKITFRILEGEKVI